MNCVLVLLPDGISNAVSDPDRPDLSLSEPFDNSRDTTTCTTIIPCEHVSPRTRRSTTAILRISGTYTPVLLDGVPQLKLPPEVSTHTPVLEDDGLPQSKLPPQTGTHTPMYVDGVPLSDLPPHFVLSAYLREKLLRNKISTSRRHRKILPRAATSTQAPASAGMDATAFCQTEECVKLMQEYEKWRQENGYGTSGGRWG
ncbi:hypothetical protein ACOMHN_046710 [Nucella lapillus]